MKKIYMILSFAALTAQSQIIKLDNIQLGASGYDNGSNQPNGKIFTDQICNFPNSYSTSFGGYWESGWAISSLQDTLTQASSFTQLLYLKDTGALSYKNFAVGQQNAHIVINVTSPKLLDNLYINNTTFAYNSMKIGDAFAKKFGGVSGNDPDFFKLTIKGFLNGVQKNDTVAFYLADFRDANNSNDYIIKNWTLVNTSILGVVDSLTFELSSSDLGAFGINTPLYFCVDNLNFSNASNINNLGTNTNSNIYPNPFSSELYIATKKDNVNYRLLDISGKSVMNGTVNKNSTFINTDKILKGYYTLELNENGNIQTKKLIKQ
jgi:hypothetical protein